MRKYIVSFVVFFFVISGLASNVNPGDAAIVAKHFYWEQSDVIHLRAIDPILKYTKYRDDQAMFYVFGFKKQPGFVIVSAETATLAVLGYSTRNAFKGDDIAPNVAFWLDHYADMIKLHKRDKKTGIKEHVHPTWAKYLGDSLTKVAKKRTVESLLSTIWGQGRYYNAYCPVDTAGPDDHALTGCVATAMGQIMNYHNHPEQGSGDTSYVHNTYGTLSANFDTTTYNWSNLPYSLTTHNEDVAKLLFHCGVSVQMDYGPDESGAFTIKARSALVNYFGYDPNAEYVVRNDSSENAWINMMKSELDLGQPMQYRAYNTLTNGGHSFICDGYDQNDFFHFNWGWSGWENGYYSINDMTPGDPDDSLNYNTNQAAIIHLYPLAKPDSTHLTEPVNGQMFVNLSQDLHWEAVPGADGYRLNVGTTTGGFDILNNFDVGQVSTYDPGDFPIDTTIYVTITPYNEQGDALYCEEEWFSTIPVPFIITIETSTADEYITIPVNYGESYKYDVDWGDGTITTGHTGNASHQYLEADSYQLSISGQFPQIYFDNSGDKDKILSVDQWGTQEWMSMENSFKGCSNLTIPATDEPDLTNVSSMNSMFHGASLLTGAQIGFWDVSNVTDMSWMFYQATSFNEDLWYWDVSSVTDMSFMFDGAAAFNGLIDIWDVSSVVYMPGMFHEATSFNKNISAWDVSSATDMWAMFHSATSFDQNLGLWDISSVTDMDEMFTNVTLSTDNYDALLLGWESNMHQANLTFDGGNSLFCYGKDARDELIADGWSITDGGEEPGCPDPLTHFITSWETTTTDESINIPTFGGGYDYNILWGDGSIAFNVTADTSHVYENPGTYQVIIAGLFPRLYFNNSGDKDKIQTIDQWGSQQWTSMERAFEGCSNLNCLAFDTPDLFGVSSLSFMFSGATSLSGDLSAWDTGTITNMSGMFKGATSFNGAIDFWSVRDVTNMASMFEGATSFDADLDFWDVSNVTNMHAMFKGASSFNGPISGWEVSNVTSMYAMFEDALDFNWDLGAWTINSVSTMECMLDQSGLSSDNYDNTLIGWDNLGVSNITLGADGLEYCQGETARSSLIGKGWSISEDELKCPFVTSWKTDNPGTSNATSITIPTIPGENYNYDIDWNNDGIYDDTGIQGDITHSYSFAGTYTIRIAGTFPGIYFNGGGDVEKTLSVDQWGDIEWTSTANAFKGAIHLTSNAVDAPDLSGVTDMSFMFYDCYMFNGDIRDWDVSSTTNMEAMFQNAYSFNQEISNWNVSNVVNMSHMFDRAYSFNVGVANWDVGAVTDMSYMFHLAISFNGDVTNWDVSSVTDMSYLFSYADSFAGDVSDWDVENVTNMNHLFENTTYFNQNLGIWDISGAPSMVAMLDSCSMTDINYDSTLIGWKDQGISGITLGAENMKYCRGKTARDTLISDLGWSINGDELECPFITTWDVELGTGYFISINVNANESYNYDVDWDNDGIYDDIGITGYIQHIYGVPGIFTIRIRGQFPQPEFSHKEKLISIDQWGNNQWASMRSAFHHCENLTLNAMDVPDLSAVTDLGLMFWGATNFTGDISGWNISSIENTAWMFWDAHNFNSDLSSWDVSNVVNMGAMFAAATSFNSDISSWDVSEVEDFHAMFYEASSFNQNLGSWEFNDGIWPSVNLENMLTLSGLSIENYDNTLIGWANSVPPSDVHFDAGGLDYCHGYDARNTLINDYNWTIDGDNFECTCNIVTNTDDAGTGSFRNALSCCPVGSEVFFSSEVFGDTIHLSTAPLSINHDLLVIADLANNIVINASAIGKLFQVASGVDAHIEGLKMICGFDSNSSCFENQGNLTLKDVEFIDEATGGSSFEAGGEIEIEGEVKILNE